MAMPRLHSADVITPRLLVFAGLILCGLSAHAADADNDGVITLDELRATTLEVARAKGVAYGTGDNAEIADLGAFVEALTQRVVTRFGATGKCTSEPVVAEAEAE